MRIVLALLLIPFSAPAQEATASITGAAVDVTGAYIPKATVVLDSGTRKYQIQADDAGVYQFSNLPAGEYTLTLQALGFYRLTVKPIKLLEGEQKRVPELILDVGASGCGTPFPPAFQLLAGEAMFGGLAGSVVRYGGSLQPVEGVDVTLVCRTFSACGSTKTDAQGLFSFGMLSPSEYGLSFRLEGFYPDQASAYSVRVKAGLESEYGPVFLERCPNGNCDPKLRPPRPPVQVVVCE
jgi:hypothetical protein